MDPIRGIMTMRTATINIYKFEELSEQAKQTAIESYRQDISYHFGYHWMDEWIDSLKTFSDMLGIVIKDYKFSPYCYSDIKWEYYADYEVVGLRLRTWIINNWLPSLRKGNYYSKGKYVNGMYSYKYRHSNISFDYCCPLTGYFGDDTLIQPILDFVKNPIANYTIRDVIEDCMDSFIKAVVSDMEYQDSDEYISEHIIANDYEFNEDGTIY